MKNLTPYGLENSIRIPCSIYCKWVYYQKYKTSFSWTLDTEKHIPQNLRPTNRQTLLPHDVTLIPRSCGGRWRSCDFACPFPSSSRVHAKKTLQDLILSWFIDKNCLQVEDFDDLQAGKQTLWPLTGKQILFDFT